MITLITALSVGTLVFILLAAVALHSDSEDGRACGFVLLVFACFCIIISIIVFDFSLKKDVIWKEDGFVYNQIYETVLSQQRPDNEKWIEVIKDQSGDLWYYELSQKTPRIFKKTIDSKNPFQPFPAEVKVSSATK